MTDEKKPPQGAGVQKLYAGVDVMHDRLEVGIYAFETGEKRVAALTLWVDPSQDEAWRLLHALLCAYPGLQAAGIDSAGHQTQQVYRFAHASNLPGSGAAHKVFATKTSSVRGGSRGLASVPMDAPVPGGRIEVLLIRLRPEVVKHDPASLDTLECAKAVCQWESLLGSCNPAMRLELGDPSVTALRVQSCLAEAELKKEAAGRATCPLARELLRAESNLSFLRAKQIAGHQAT